MRVFNKVTIVGVGLIGGSIGLAIKRRGVANEVIGVFRHRKTLVKALKAKAVDRAVEDLASGVRDADLIVIASPVASIPPLAQRIASLAKRGAILTDVGSTKGWIVREVERSLGASPRVFFVGSHPMAGSDKTGVEFSRDDLLQGAPAIVTKTRATDREALAAVTAFWKSLGADVAVTSPARHDRAIAAISHMPHLAAFGIVGASPRGYLKYAAEGFKDTTRVASSDPELWADIFLTNAREVARSVAAFERYCRKILRAISRDDRDGVIGLLASAKAKRDAMYHGR